MNRGSFIRNIFALGIGAQLPGKLRNYKKNISAGVFCGGISVLQRACTIGKNANRRPAGATQRTQQ